jgi:hypothetical protein
VSKPDKKVKDINNIIKEIIPPADYQHRNGFSNENIILSLSEKEKLKVENRLIQMLSTSDDELIGESLVILKSQKALSILNDKLTKAKKPNLKIIWASYINEIENGNDKMKNIAFEELQKISEKYILIDTLYYASRFNDSRINNKIRTFINHNDYLIAYNARRYLGISTKEFQGKNLKKDKVNWWQFWKRNSN